MKPSQSQPQPIYTMSMVYNRKQQSGFALLISLLVVSIVISVGLVILDLTIKQVRLASNATDSELAFHAANAGMECARFWRRDKRDDIIGNQFANPTISSGGTLDDITCFQGSAIDVNPSSLVSNSDGEVYVYQYEFEWDGGNRCSEIDMVVTVTDISGNGLDLTNNQMRSVLPSYPAGESFECPTGSNCTAIASRGYNRGCGQKNNFGTVQREVLLEF